MASSTPNLDAMIAKCDEHGVTPLEGEDQVRLLVDAEGDESVLDAVIRQWWHHGHPIEENLAALMDGAWYQDLDDEALLQTVRRRLRHPRLVPIIIEAARARQEEKQAPKWPSANHLRQAVRSLDERFGERQ